eukprot:8511916-Pyramimonas_sp.AAC.1
MGSHTGRMGSASDPLHGAWDMCGVPCRPHGTCIGSHRRIQRNHEKSWGGSGVLRNPEEPQEGLGNLQESKGTVRGLRDLEES